MCLIVFNSKLTEAGKTTMTVLPAILPKG